MNKAVRATNGLDVFDLLSNVLKECKKYSSEAYVVGFLQNQDGFYVFVRDEDEAELMPNKMFGYPLVALTPPQDDE